MPHECIAREIYEMTRGLSAFNIKPKHTKGKNQHATYYRFEDGSTFIVYAFGCYAYRGTDGLMYARRTDYSKAREHQVEFGQESLRLLGCR